MCEKAKSKKVGHCIPTLHLQGSSSSKEPVDESLVLVDFRLGGRDTIKIIWGTLPSEVNLESIHHKGGASAADVVAKDQSSQGSGNCDNHHKSLGAQVLLFLLLDDGVRARRRIFLVDFKGLGGGFFLEDGRVNISVGRHGVESNEVANSLLA